MGQVSLSKGQSREGAFINRSLITLGTVIYKLSEGHAAHVPFRDSKLTRLLQVCMNDPLLIYTSCKLLINDGYEQDHHRSCLYFWLQIALATKSTPEDLTGWSCMKTSQTHVWWQEPRTMLVMVSRRL